MTSLDVSPKATQDDHWVCTEWLNRESALLDDRLLHEWLELLHLDLEYTLPVRITREREHGSGFSDTSFHMYEDHESLSIRVKRLDTDYAWAEDPPSRARRLVSNIRVESADAGSYEVRSNFFIFRSRLDEVANDLLVGERRDRLVTDGGVIKLRKREVLLDHSTLPTKNLAVFF